MLGTYGVYINEGSIMYKKDFNKFAHILKSITGSTMKDADMFNRYNALINKDVKNYLI